MASSEMIETAFGALEISRNAVLLTQGVEVVETTSDQLVGIGLMPDVPDDPVSIQIEGLIQGQGELNDTEARAEMATAGGHHLKVTIPNLTSDIFKFGHPETVQLIRMLQISEMHAPSTPVRAIYGVRSLGPLALNMGRMEG